MTVIVIKMDELKTNILSLKKQKENYSLSSNDNSRKELVVKLMDVIALLRKQVSISTNEKESNELIQINNHVNKMKTEIIALLEKDK